MASNADLYDRIKCRLFRSHFNLNLGGDFAQARAGVGGILWSNGKFQQVKGLEKLPGGYYCLGYLYQHGSGVEPNLKEALGWYQQGASRGSVASMLALARMYENGEGTKPDRVQAFVWLIVAAQRGNQDAIAEAKGIRASMTEKEWKDTQKKLPRNFDPEKGDSFLRGAGSPPTQ